MPVAPDRVLPQDPSWYPAVRGAEAERLEPSRAARWKNILVPVKLLIAALVLAVAFWPYSWFGRTDGTPEACRGTLPSAS